MRVLLVADNEFKAFCLRRLLECVLPDNTLTIVNNSNAALKLCYSYPFDLAIIDGDLGTHKSYCNGPDLAQVLLYKYPHVPLIAWTDSVPVRRAFSQLFAQYECGPDDVVFWNKTVSVESIRKTWAYYSNEFMQASVSNSNRPSVTEHRFWGN